jgi:HEPN domain-containing protein
MGRVKAVSRDRFAVFLGRARQYLDSMDGALGRGDYDACVGNAVHCAISALDVLAVKMLGRKSSGQNHTEAFLLLKEIKALQESEKSKVSDAALELIGMKTAAEYDDKAMSKADAEKAARLCRRVFGFAEKELGN